MGRMFGVGKVVLVTGSRVRLGRAIAEALRRAGFAVVVHGRTEGDVTGDFAVPGVAAEVFAAALARFGRLDGVVNNAAVFGGGVADDVVLRVNVEAPRVLSELLFEHVRDAGRRGWVVNVLDERIARPPVDVYGLSKRELAKATGVDAKRFAPVVRVNGVAPGSVLKPVGVREQARPKLLDGVPSPEAVGEAVEFLAGAEFVTGQIVFVDAGQHLVV